jgi:FlaA1/EpsC-like NDP-sugar epimerase
LGVGRFVLVSTDKAVAPATVMGASKALAEFALEAATARFHGTSYAAVRFGNVLGSSGSVVPIFRSQIERGGPVTVTDERMTRYFMTIPEAVQLIIRSGSLATGGGRGADVFVLDMGEPVRIVELARAMIELSGLDPDRDVEIELVGRRAGEKLHEELFNGYERPRATAAEKIMLAEREPLAPETVEAMFDEIGLLVLEGDAAGLAARVSELSAVRAELSAKVSGRERADVARERQDVAREGAEPARETAEAARGRAELAREGAAEAARERVDGSLATPAGDEQHRRAPPAPLIDSRNR